MSLLKKDRGNEDGYKKGGPGKMRMLIRKKDLSFSSNHRLLCHSHDLEFFFIINKKKWVTCLECLNNTIL
jgi:hypothetical protein